MPLGSWRLAPASAENPDYAAAFRWVRERWQEGDLMLSPSVASMIYLGQLDYYLLESGYSGTVVETAQGQLNSNSGAPRLQGTEGLAAVLDGPARVWVVFDEGRFPNDLSEESQALLTETTELVWAEQGMRVYQSHRPYQEIVDLLAEEAADRDVIVTSRPSQFESIYEGPLPVYTLDPASNQDQIRARLQSLVQDGRRVWYLRWKEPYPSYQLAWLDYQWQTHTYRRAQWAFGDADLFVYAIEGQPSFDAAPDLTLEPAWLVGDVLRLDQVTAPSLRASWGHQVGVELDWTVLARTDRYLSQTVHVVDADGRRWGQADVWMVDTDGKPTVDWEAGQRVHQELAIELCPGLSPGVYRLVYTARDRLSGADLPLRDAQGREIASAELGVLEVLPPPYQPSLTDDIHVPFELNRALAPAVTLVGAVDTPGKASFGQNLAVGLVWRAPQTPAQDYRLRLRLTAQDGAVLGEGVYPLAQASYPTSEWRAGEIIWRYYNLHVDDSARDGLGSVGLDLARRQQRAGGRSHPAGRPRNRRAPL